MKTKTKPRLPSAIILGGFFLLSAIESLISALFLLSIPADVKNQLVWGYSLRRLILLAGLLLISTASFWLARFAWQNEKWSTKVWENIFGKPRTNARLLLFFSLILMIAVSILLTPLYRFGIWAAFIERLLPLIVWMACVSAQACLGLLYWGNRIFWNGLVMALKQQRMALYTAGVVFLGLAALWIWIARTGIGLRAKGMMWYDAGVPLLGGQIWLVVCLLLAIAWIFFRFVRNSPRLRALWQNHPNRIDITIGFILWLIAAFLWVSQPMPPNNFFAPGPYLPEKAYYPYSDAAFWDQGGQFALIGQGIANRNAFADHAGFMGFLAMLHLLVGQDYSRVVTLQVVLFAIFPAILYWLGKSLHSRAAGLLIAGLAIFHESNAIAAGTMINTSHVKLLMTEFPTGIFLAVLALWLSNWLKEPQDNRAYTLPIGGALGLLVLIRYNTLVIPLAVLFGTLLAFGRNWQTWLKSSLLLILSITVILSPWMWRSWKLSGTPFFFAEKASYVFQKEFRSPLPPTQTPTPLPPSSFEMGLAPWSPIKMGLAQTLDSPISSRIPFLSKSERQSTIGEAFIVVVNHFVHNLITSVLILPTTPFFHDLRTMIYEIRPFWEKMGVHWTGALTPIEAISLSINLLILSVGIGVSWKRLGIAGLVPLGVFLAYHFSAALARASGGRYIVPVDWVVIVYFGIGLIQLLFWGSAIFDLHFEGEQRFPLQKIFSFKKGVFTLLPFLLFVGAMTVLDQAMPRRYPALTKAQILDIMIKKDLLAQAGVDTQELSAFLAEPDARAYLGLALFPRFYFSDEGDDYSGFEPVSPKNYPRLFFTMIGPQDSNLFGTQAILPFSRSPEYFPNATDLILIGCQHKKPSYIDAVFVVIIGEEEAVYVRSPGAPLSCPLPEPVCDNNRVCR